MKYVYMPCLYCNFELQYPKHDNSLVYAKSTDFMGKTIMRLLWIKWINYDFEIKVNVINGYVQQKNHSFLKCADDISESNCQL